jgi:WD40 repeat protein
LTRVALSPDGSRIVSGTDDGMAKVWDARTGTTLFDLKGHNGEVSSAAFSPDGSRIVSGSRDSTAKVWDARTGKPLLEFRGHSGEVSSVAFSPDGAQIVSGSDDLTAKVWDAGTGATLLDLKGHTFRVTCVAFSPDGSRVLTGSVDSTAILWDALTGKPLLELRGHVTPVSSVAFSPDGSRIVTAADESGKVWDARTGTPLLDLKGHVASASFSPDGSRIVTAGDQTAKVWDPQTGTPLLELKGNLGIVTSASFSADGTRIVAGGTQKAVVWDARPLTSVLELKGHTGTVWPHHLWYGPDGSRIVSASDDGTAKVWDAKTGALLQDLKGHRRAISSVGLSPDGTRIVTGSWDKTAKVWDTLTGALLHNLTAHSDVVCCVRFSPDGTRIVSGGWDNTAKVWDAQAGTLLLDLKGQTGSVWRAWFSPDGTRIVTDVDEPRVYDARTGEELKGEPIPPAPRPVQTSPNGRILAHSAGRHVELIPLQPEPAELAYRELQARPNFARYREGYEVARAAQDDFASRFYFNLFPLPERTRIRAEEVVGPLFSRLQLRDDVLAALQSQPAADPEIQAACLKLAATWPESAQECNNVARPLVTYPGQPSSTYRRCLRLAKAACGLVPDNGTLLDTLGMAQYRCGLTAEAVVTLTRSIDLNKGARPGGLAFLAMAQNRLGHREEARRALGRLREVMKNPQWANPQARDLHREAETIELDQLFPAKPFAP